MGQTFKVADNKIKNNMNDSKTHSRKSCTNYNKKDKTNNNDSIAEIQVSDLDTSIESKDNDSTD